MLCPTISTGLLEVRVQVMVESIMPVRPIVNPFCVDFIAVMVGGAH